MGTIVVKEDVWAALRVTVTSWKPAGTFRVVVQDSTTGVVLNAVIAKWHSVPEWVETMWDDAMSDRPSHSDRKYDPPTKLLG